MTSNDPAVIAMIRYVIIQAARDGDLELANRSDSEVRVNVLDLMHGLVRSNCELSAQFAHESRLVRAARRFDENGEADLAIVMYATAVEHWLNGMLAVGLERRGEELTPATEKGTLAQKLGARWRDLFDVEFPERLRSEVLELATARNDFVHYKWPSRSEAEDAAHRSATRAIAGRAPGLLLALDKLENLLVFNGERSRLERILDEMALPDAPQD